MNLIMLEKKISLFIEKMKGYIKFKNIKLEKKSLKIMLIQMLSIKLIYEALRLR